MKINVTLNDLTKRTSCYNSIGAGVRALKASLKYITAIIGNVFTSPTLNLGFASYQCNTKKQ